MTTKQDGRGRDGAEPKVRGVNLGNWLVLEKWMGVSPLARSRSEDDHGLASEFEPDVLDAALEEHRLSFVTEDTFAWLASCGVNVARVPVPYHIFGTAHHRACVAHLDHAMDWAATQGMGLLVDLHTVPMSQNGFDNGGYVGMCAWHKDPARIEAVLDVLERIAARYAGHPALWGIEPLNEPASKSVFESTMRRYAQKYPERVASSAPVPRATLRLFYERFYARVRPIVGSGVRLVLHDQFDLGAWNRFMVGPAYENVWLDTHQYLNFSELGFRRYDLREYQRVLSAMERKIRRAARHHPVLVGEWSLGNHSPLVRSLPDDEQRRWYRALCEAQLAAWDKGAGGCYWSLRVESPGREMWSFVDCVERGWMTLA